MRAPRVRHVLLVVAGTVLLGSGSVLAGTAPRAEAPDIGSAAETPTPGRAAARPLVADRIEPREVEPPVPSSAAPQEQPRTSAPTQVSLPRTPEPVPLTPVGVLPSGALHLPEQPSRLGWFAAGAVPGDAAGTAVIAGHLDSARYGAGPLEVLLHLAEGDVIEVTDAAGAGHRFAVTSRTSYAKSALPAEVFRPDGPPRLALVTCGGEFDEETGNYADNVVVFAKLID